MSTAAESPAGTVLGRLARLPLLFLAMVVVPTILAVIYYLFIAAPIYVSEARFLVRMPAERALPAMAGLTTMLEGVGLKSADIEAFAVHEYIMSRNVIADIEAEQSLREVYSRPEADFLARFPRPFQKPTAENLFKTYERFVKVEYDTTTGISTLLVKAFRPEDANTVAKVLLDQGEIIVNRLNDQAESDAVTESLRDMIDAQERVSDVQTRLTQYRNQNQIVDPETAGVVGLELIGSLSAELAAMRAERSAMAISTPQNPQLPGLDQRIAAYERQLNAERAQIVGDRDSLATKIGGYERLMLEREFMTRALASATMSVEEARMEARRKQLYLQRVVEPVIADSAQFPRRWRNILLVLVTALLAYGAVALIVAGLREHRQ